MSQRSLRRCVVGAAVAAGTSFLLAACAPVPDPSAGLTAEESIALIGRVEPSDIELSLIAESFALGTRATDVQRENIRSELLARRVEWDIPVYEVSLTQGRYEVTSQPIPVQDADAIPLIRVMAYVIPRNDADEAVLEQIKTDDVIRLQGIVQEIRLRTIVVLVPAVLSPRPLET